MIKKLLKYQNEEIGSYSPGLNTIKAILVIFVVFGHAINVNSNLQIIYFFHMPLFLAISGFLVKKSAFDNGIIAYLKKLMNRAIIPWLIAFVLFVPVSFYHHSISSFSYKNIIYPYYHLWYIPAYVIATVFCYFIMKLKIPSWFVIVFTVLTTSYWFVVFRNSHLSASELPLFYLGDKRIYGYLLFFYLGFSIRNGTINYKPNPLFLLVLIGLSSLSILFLIFKHQPDYTLLLPYLICNISLLFFSVIYLSSQNWSENKFLLFLNNQSLGIYLYHPIFIFIAYELLNDPKMNQTSNSIGLIIFIFSLVLSYLLVWSLSKFNFTNKYLLGNIKK